MKCKLTDKEIKPFMSFGKMPLANGFLDKEEIFAKEKDFIKKGGQWISHVSI